MMMVMMMIVTELDVSQQWIHVHPHAMEKAICMLCYDM